MNNKLPITRLSKFFSQDDFDINIQMGQEYLHGDLNMKLVLALVLIALPYRGLVINRAMHE